MASKAYFIIFSTTLWSQIITAEFCNSTPSVIVTQPLDVTVREGEDAVFSCTVSRFNPDTDYIEWKVNPFTYSSISSNGFDQSTRHMTSSIGFPNVGKEARTVIFVSWMNKQKEKTMCTSREAHLNVLFFPKREDLLCSPTTLHDLPEDETLRIKCEVLQGNPPVNMSWFIEGINIFSPHAFYESNKKMTSQDLHITRKLHNQTIKCLVRSQTFFPDEQLECHVGPMMVLHKPVIYLSSNNTKFLGEEDTKQLRCDGNAYPPIREFSWSCMPPDVLNGCNSNTNTINLSIVDSFGNNAGSAERTNLGSVEETKVFVTCIARNSEGISNATLEITIVTPVELNKHTSKNCKENILTLQRLDAVEARSISETSFLCSVIKIDSFQDSSSNISWYLDGIPIQYLEENRISVEQHTSSSSVLTIKNIKKARAYVTIACVYHKSNCNRGKRLSLKEFINVVGQKPINMNATIQAHLKQTNSLTNTIDNDGGERGMNNEKASYNLGDTNMLLTGISIMGGILIAVCLSTTIMLVFHKHCQNRTTNANSINANSTKASADADFQNDDQIDVHIGKSEPNPTILPTTAEHQIDQEIYHDVNDGELYEMNIFKTYFSSDTNISSSFSSGASLSSVDMEDQPSDNTTSSSNYSIKSTDGMPHLYVNQEIVEMTSL